MSTFLDWSVIVGAFSIAGTMIVKWFIPAVLSLGKNGTNGALAGAAQAASREVVDAIDAGVSDFRKDLTEEIRRMSEYRMAMTLTAKEITKEQQVLAEHMTTLAEAVAVVQRQQEVQVRDALARSEQNAVLLTAIAKKMKV